MTTYEQYLNAVNQALQTQRLLCGAGSRPVTETDGILSDELPPQPLRSAMHYSLLLPGKRVRPVLLLAAYNLLKEDWNSVMDFACGLEMIHTYSLVHDDLPAMDNDEYRRGQLTNHKVFGEDMAILAGDGLLNMAYEVMLSSDYASAYPEKAIRAIREIAVRAGVTGMVAGQTLDVKLEGKPMDEKSLVYIHRHKTADLLTAPVTAGLMLAGASEEQLAAARVYGHDIGLAFQIRDDILDVEGDASLLGKNTGMDAVMGKLTWPLLHGLEQSKAEVERLAEEAANALSCFGESANFLQEFALKLAKRNC